MGQIDCSGTEDLGLMARLMYGYVLSNTSVLDPAETSFVMIAGLIPMDVSQSVNLVERLFISIGKSSTERTSQGSFEW